MKKILLIIVICIISNTSVFGQRFGNAYKGLSIESESDYEARKSRDYSITFSTYSGPKTYIQCNFVDGHGYCRYYLYRNGSIYDSQNDCLGDYFVGTESQYKLYTVYVKWYHGGEQVCYLDYSRRSDGMPVFKYVTSSGGWKVFKPEKD